MTLIILIIIAFILWRILKSNEKNKDWVEFFSSDKTWKIDFPEYPSQDLVLESNFTAKLELNSAGAEMYLYKTRSYQLMITVFDVKKNNNLLERSIKVDLEEQTNHLIQKRKFLFNDKFEAIDFKMSNATTNSYLRGRHILRKNRFYTISAHTKEEYFPIPEKFINSFSFTGK